MTKQNITSDLYITGIQRINSNARIVSTTWVLYSDALIAEEETSIICDGSDFDEIINEFASPITIRVVSKSFDQNDAYATPQETYVDYSKQAMVQRYTASDNEVREGVFKSGQVVMSFKMTDEALVVTGNRVKYLGDWYEISEVIKQPLVDVLYYLQATVKKC